ncbi:MAG: tetratricopeptide repeat protein [Bacteroidia bacterium]|nr:tetratricopeptide repeat protein [Bacteroidia bacterium]MDW8057636.1 tetratricopeptide repeat protein [Bacteroidia bacterium]
MNKLFILLCFMGKATLTAQSLRDSIRYYEEKGNPSEMIRMVRQMRAALPSKDSIQISETYYWEGYAWNLIGEIHKAEEALKLALFWAPAGHAGRIDICNVLAKVYVDKGDLSQARIFLDQGLNLAQTLRDTAGWKRVLTALSYYAYYKEDFHAMFGHSQQLLALIGERVSEEPREYLAALTNAGLALHSLGRQKEAEKYFRQAWAAAYTYSVPHYLRAKIAENLGMSLEEQGFLEEAFEFYRKADTLYQKSNAQLDRSHLYNNIGRLLIDLGDLKGAYDYLQQAKELIYRYDTSGGSPVLPNVLINLGFIALMWKEYAAAESLLAQAERAAALLQAPSLTAYIKFLQGEVWAHQGRLSDARQAYEEGLLLIDTLLETGSDFYPKLLNRLGLLALREANLIEAEYYLREAHYRFLKFMHSSISPYDPDVISHIGGWASLYEKQGRWRESDSAAILAFKKAFIRFQLYLPMLSFGQRADMIEWYVKPYYLSLQERISRREDSALTAAGLWASHVMEVLEGFSVNESLFTKKPVSQEALHRWKASLLAYQRAEREGEAAQAESLLAVAQTSYAQLRESGYLPPLEPQEFFQELGQKLSKKEALVKVVHAGDYYIAYAVRKRRGRLLVHRQVIPGDLSQLQKELSLYLQTFFPKSTRRIHIFSVIEISLQQLEGSKRPSQQIIFHTQNLMWRWMAQKRLSSSTIRRR